MIAYPTWNSQTRYPKHTYFFICSNRGFMSFLQRSGRTYCFCMDPARRRSGKRRRSFNNFVCILMYEPVEAF